MPGATHQEQTEQDLAAAPYGVVGSLADLETARVLIQDLEEHGVPPGSIGLLGAVAKDADVPGRESELAESEALGQVGRSAIAGGAVGAVVGAVLGALATVILPDLSLLAAAGLGAVFGAAVGGAAGGMSVAKYSSPAWQETYQTEEDGRVKVAVHHVEAKVVDAAEEVMRRHPVLAVSRLEQGRPEAEQ